jgi:hypothetical protein
VEKIQYSRDYTQRKMKWSKGFRIYKATNSYYCEFVMTIDSIFMLILYGFY